MDIEQADALIAYLRDARRIGRHETPRVETLAGGVSNRNRMPSAADRHRIGKTTTGH